MNKFNSVISGDLKNISRDPTLLLLLIVPFILLAVLRFGMPIVAGYYPEISRYYPVILGLFALLNASFPAFIGSFILLDEKDLTLFPVIKVTPVSLSGFLLVRLCYLSFIGFFTGIMLINLNGFMHVSFGESIELAILCVLNAPIQLLLMVAFSRNKVEGVTRMKAASILLIVPMLVFFVTTPYEYLFALLPAFWAYMFLDTMASFGVFIVGFFLLLFYNILSFRLFIRVTNRSV